MLAYLHLRHTLTYLLTHFVNVGLVFYSDKTPRSCLMTLLVLWSVVSLDVDLTVWNKHIQLVSIRIRLCCRTISAMQTPLMVCTRCIGSWTAISLWQPRQSYTTLILVSRSLACPGWYVHVLAPATDWTSEGGRNGCLQISHAVDHW